MKKIWIAVTLILCGMNSNVYSFGGVCTPPMNNVRAPMVNVVPQQFRPGGGFCQPHTSRYPLVPLYVQPLFQAQEMIYVDIVRAIGSDLRYGHNRQIQFEIGRCGDGTYWCKAGVMPSRFSSEFEALRYVEMVMSLKQGSLREISRHTNCTPWYIN